MNHNRFLGYTKDEEGHLVIVPEEAEIVKRIYAEYMDDQSFLQIKRGLEADGILNGLTMQNGMKAISNRSCPMKSTSAMRSCRRLTR